MGLNGENGWNWHKKEKNLEIIGGKVQKNLRKNQNLINSQDLIIVFSKTINAHCAFIRYCRVLGRQFTFKLTKKYWD